MKKLIYILMCTASLFMSQSCSKEAPFSGEEETMGQVMTSNLLLEFINEDLQSRAGTDVNLADFTVAFRKNSEQTPYVEYKYSEMPEVVSLPAGLYRVEAYYGKEVDADWDAPYYFGSVSDPLTVTAKKIATVEKPIKCKLANVKVSVEFNDELKMLMSAESKVDVTVGADTRLSFSKDESRKGFFKAANTMVANFLGEVNGQEANASKQYNDVKPGTHYHILFVYKAAQIVGDGKIDPNGGIHVDAKVEITDVNDGTNLDAGGDDEYLEDDRNKGGEDDDNPDVPTPPATEGPVCTPSKGIRLVDGGADAVKESDWIEVTDGMTCVVTITSATGIQGFTAEIVSDVLNVEDVGLSTTLDMCNPGSNKDELIGLGLLPEDNPSYLNAKTAVFDLTGFMPMLQMLGAADHKFVLKVQDASGSVTQTLPLRLK